MFIATAIRWLWPTETGPTGLGRVVPAEYLDADRLTCESWFVKQVKM